MIIKACHLWNVLIYPVQSNLGKLERGIHDEALSTNNVFRNIPNYEYVNGEYIVLRVFKRNKILIYQANAMNGEHHYNALFQLLIL